MIRSEIKIAISSIVQEVVLISSKL